MTDDDMILSPLQRTLLGIAKPEYDVRSVVRDAIDDAIDRIEALEQWLLKDCECPICLAKDVCPSDCTFAEDDPAGHERMISARLVMWS